MFLCVEKQAGRTKAGRTTGLFFGTLLSSLICILGSSKAFADLELTPTLDGTTLVNQIINPAQNGIVINSVTVFGNNGQIGTFTNGLSEPGFLTFDQGIILSSGQIDSIAGPNASDGTGTNEDALAGADGDADFNSLTTSPQGTFDAAYIEIDFTPTQNMIRGSFVFASDEYNEYAPPDGTSSAGNTYFDVMAFFVNGVNHSITASGEHVSINSVNATLNAADFFSNDRENDGIPTPFNIEADGFTRKLTWTAIVNPGVPNTLKFGVADGGDASYNSWLLVDKYAFEVAPAPTTVDLTLTKTDNASAVAVGTPITYEFTVTNIGSGPTGREIVVTDTLPNGVTVNGGIAEALDELGENASEWTCQSTDSTPQEVICKSTVEIYVGSGNDHTSFAFQTDPIVAALDGTTLVNSAVVSTTDTDSDNSNNSASDSTLVTTTDVTAPTVFISGMPAVVDTTSPITIDVEFNETVTGFTLADMLLVNATASNVLSTGNNTYSVDITPTAAGDLTISVAANAAQDAAGNQSSASNTATVAFNSNAVELVISNAPAYVANNNTYNVAFGFSEAVSGFTLADIQVTNGTPSNFVAVTPDSFTADITPDGSGDIVVNVLASAASDLAGLDPSLSDSVTTEYNISAPVVDILGAPSGVSTTASFPVSFQFSEWVTNFIAADIVVAHGALSNFIAVDGDTYTATVTPTGYGDITIDVPLGVAIDIASNGNQAAAQSLTHFDNQGPVLNVLGLPSTANSNATVPLTFEFDEDVVGFELSDISISNASLSGFVAIDGNTFSANLSPSGAGNVSLSIVAGAAQDSYGNNSETAAAHMVYDDQAPLLSIATVALDDIINASEDDDAVLISGTASGLEASQAISVSLNGIDYITNAVAGHWSVSVPALHVQALDATETITANATDVAGNAAVPITKNIQHDATFPTAPVVTSVQTNSLTPVISGLATVGAGEVLSVVVNSHTYHVGDGHLVAHANGTWTLSVPSFNALTEGVYSVDANVVDAAGNSVSDASASELSIDTTAPTAGPIAVDLAASDDSGSEDTDNVTNTQASSFSVPAGSATAGDSVTLFANGISVASGTVAANGGFSLVSTSLADGHYAISYAYTDAVGNQSALAPALHITVDTETAAPLIATPIAGDNIISASESSAVWIEGSAEAFSVVQLSFDDAINPPIVVTVSSNASGNWTLLGNEVNIGTLDDGLISVSASATDTAGNENTATAITLTLDATAPVVPTVSSLITNTGTPTLNGTATVETGDLLSVKLNGVTYTATGSELSDNGDGTWALVVPEGNALSQAIYDVEVSVIDSSANRSTDTTTNELEVDITPPAVPTVYAQISASSTPSVQGTATVGSGETLSVTINGVLYTAGDGSLVDNTDGTWNLTVPAANALSDATYNVEATVSDAAANVSTDASSAELLVDTTVPVVPAVAALVTSMSSPVISGTATVAADEVLTVAVGGVVYTVGDGALFDNGDGTWTLTIPAVNALVDGVYDVSAVVTDRAGNVASETSIAELTIDTTPPSTPVVAPNLISSDDSGIANSDNITQVAIPTFDVPAGTATAGQVVTVFANGSQVGTTTVVADGGFSVSSASLSDGNFTISYTLTDSANNVSPVSPGLNITIDSATSTPVIGTPIATDNTVNLNEQHSVLISGTAEANSSVLVSLSDGVHNDINVSVTTDASGVWTLLGSEANISGLNDGVISVAATSTDTAGNSANATQVSINHDTTIPVLAISAVSIDNQINATEDNSDIAIMGSSVNVEDGQIVTFSLNGKTYTATVNGNAWRVTLPAIDAQELPSNSTLVATVQNAAGNESSAVSQTLVHDTTLPIISIDAIAIDNIINATEDDSAVLVSGTSVGLDDGQAVEITLNSRIYSAKLNTNVWSVSVPAIDVQALPENNILSANANDLSGNEADQVDAILQHDIAAPSVLISDAPIATGANSENYVIGGSCSAEDENVVASIAGSTPASQAILCNSAGEWSATFNVSAIADANNAIVINATQTDAAGNSGSATVVQADKNTTVPSITVATVAGDNYINAVEDDSALSISGTTTSVEDGQIAIIHLNGKNYNATVISHSWSVVVPQNDVAALDTSETITADVSNVAGTSAPQATLSIIHDATPPSIPTVTGLLTNATEPTITGTATTSAGDILQVTLNSITYTAGDGHLVDNYDGTWALTIPTANALTEATYDVTVEVTDVAGNTVSESTSGELVIDTSGPSAGGVAPDLISADDSGLSDTDNITQVVAATFNVPTSTAVAGDTAVLFANGVEIANGTVSGDGSFSISTALPGDGVYAIHYVLMDPAGNKSGVSPATSVTLDTSIQTPTIDTPIEGDNTVNASEHENVLVTGTAEAYASIEVSFDDANNDAVSITISADGSGYWTLLSNEADLSGLDEGSISVNVSASDIAGNTALANAESIVHDSTAATIPTVVALVTNSTVPVISGTATIGAEDVLTVQLNGVTYTAGAGALVDNGDGTWTLSVPANDALSDATYAVLATVYDVAGNSAIDETNDELIIDTVIPSAATVHSQIAANATPTVTGTVELLAGESLEVNINEKRYTVADELVLAADGTWTVAIPAIDALPDAHYDVLAVVRDAAGNTAEDVSVNELIVDTVAPIVPTVVAQTTNVASPTVSGTASLQSGETLTVSVNGVNYTNGDGHLNHSPNGQWSLVIPVAAALSDGSHQVVVTLVDAAGNASIDASTAELTIDTKAPLVPTVSSIATNSTTPSITGTATVGVGETLEVSVGGTTYFASGNDLSNSGDGTWTLVIPPGNALSQANYDVIVSVTDSAGNTSVDSTTSELIVDTTSPAVPTVVAMITNTATPVIRGMADVGAGESLQVAINGVTYSVGAELSLNGTLWSLTIPVGDALAESTYEVIATVVDLSGNASVDISGAEITVDTTAPTISIASIAGDNTVNAIEDDTAIVVSGTTTGVEDGQSVSLSIGSISYVATVSGGNWSVTVSAADAQALPATANVNATVSDVAGNSATPAALSLIHDTQAPSVSITKVPQINVDNAANYIISGSCSTGEADVVVTASQGTPSSQTSPCSATGEWRATFDLSAVSDGEAASTFTAAQSDGAGNASLLASADANKDASVPTLLVSNLGTGADTIYNAAESVNVQLVGTTSGVEDLQTVTLLFSDGTNNVSASATVSDSAWAANAVDLSALNEGAITLTATVRDAAANAATPAVSALILDTVRPVINANDYGPAVDNTPLFSGSSDLQNGATITVTGIDNQVYCTATVESSAWSCESTLALADGSWSFVAEASDAAGNANSDNFVAQIDANIDTDADGISDVVEGSDDTDNDGLANYLDTDSDGDGIADADETVFDTDNDGVPNYIDVDSDNDGLSDLTEGEIDADKDGKPDYIDLDSDNDGVPDLLEAGVSIVLDTNDDGKLDGAVGINGMLDAIETAFESGIADYNNDSIADIALDTDQDGVADFRDLDADNDGVADVVEAGGEHGGSGGVIANYSDNNGDGLHDPVAFTPLSNPDTDNDGVADRLSLDSDNDGIYDLVEAGGVDSDDDGLVDALTDANADGFEDALALAPLPDTDTDGDSLADRVDNDSDGDGIVDSVEANGGNGELDTDADGTPNHLDLDSDDDTLLDADEGLNDLDADGVQDYIDNNSLSDTDGDGINDSLEGFGDVDGDSIPNFQDTDSDGDGIDDADELNADTDKDGIPDFLDLDSDGDGISDLVETNDDLDGDGIANYLDLDSDDDEISDAVEAGANAASPVDSDSDGDADFLDVDSDEDGIEDYDEGATDVDGDGLANYLDTDSDNDGIDDSIEADADEDGDGIINMLDNDSDGDGILDSVEGSSDLDNDGVENYIDSDADGDGIDDRDEGTEDVDGDGAANFLDMDSDGDSISDSTETQSDLDGDGIANYLDTDSDGDGIADVEEVGPVPGKAIDTDKDGTPDYLSTDSDSDGIDDAIEGLVDTDNDGLSDFIDPDSDGDGISDLIEGVEDFDNDGAPNYVDLDSDGDGINDLVEAGLTPSQPKDSDGDGSPDYLNLDSDGDGIPDLTEGALDSDGDGIPDANDSESNGDGLPDLVVGTDDADGDGIPNYLDGDIDGDGLSNTSEGVGDIDGDGIANYLDTDSDGDGIADVLEKAADADGDGIPNYLDTDSDGDGIVDQAEVGADPTYPLDTDADGIADFLDEDSDADGIPDVVEKDIDSDGDATPDYVDTDSDNDGLDDATEGVVDSDGDGVRNYIDTDSDGDGLGDEIESAVDTDGDALPNYLDTDSDGDHISDGKEGAADSDSDGIPDYIDLDSDADGIPDSVETAADEDADGVSNYVDLDSDGDGVSDFVEAGSEPSNPVDSDADGAPDYLDLDSDGDGILDTDEGEIDSDGDGLPDSRDPDSNNDGIPDVVAGNNDLDGDGLANFLDADIDGDGIQNLADGTVDSDGDGLLNYLDTDSDNDGISDLIERNIDSDGDGTPNFIDTDSDGDSLLDSVEGAIDSDGDLLANYVDEDSDNDSINDVIELDTDTDADGVPNYLDLDADGDGILDSYETETDTDNDGTANFLDNDSDGDGIEDSIEHGANASGSELAPLDSDKDGIYDFTDQDSDGDGISDLIETNADADTDGIPNYLDTDSDNDGVADLLEQDGDKDGDTLANFLDSDSDGDGIKDSVEGANDFDNDGAYNFLDTDSDGDGIPDSLETTNDNDADNSANFLDLDSDSDGVADNVEAGDDPLNPVDTDSDGIPDFLDTDSDGDGILDVVEGADDLDGDGTPNLQDLDDNNDGIPDSMLDDSDTDGDTIPDFLDNDIDGDGIGNSSEGLGDADGDGILNFLDLDSDNDGIPDSTELANNLDGDGLPNFLDTDSDGDGILDRAETLADADSDGIPNYLDADADGDGISDLIETNSDYDSDGIPNYLDLDSDGDGVPDGVEGGADVDGDGLINSIDTDSDGDTIHDVVEAGVNPNTPIDTDGDGVADMFELDSDNDGILDADEGITDNDGDGIPNTIDLDSNNDGIPDADVGDVDTDGDGVKDYLDADIDGDGIPNHIETADDSDGDGVPNYSDYDSDDDGIADKDETGIDSDSDGTPNFLDSDSDNDGLLDSVEDLFDTDGDGIANFIDIDSDNDGLPDYLELDTDSEEDDTPNYLDTDSDNDGLNDGDEGIVDSDGDGLPNYLDADSDNDGISDLLEGSVDSDGDGVANFLDNDSDKDTISDLVETSDDTDGDGIPNFVDSDSDGDGINDVIELDIDTDGDGTDNFLDLDSDGDGIDDAVEAGMVNGLPVDTDGDGIANYLDTDSDGDGLSDADEGGADLDGDNTPNYLDTDSDGDGIDDADEGTSDTDGDGIPDALETDSDNDGISDAEENDLDTDGDGIPNYIDSDSDGDGISDLSESADDVDGDGIPNYLDLDSDGDGMSDEQEGIKDTDLDTIGNFLDTDSDDDGIDDADEAGTNPETPLDSDNDGIPDHLDDDADNDAIKDGVEGLDDTDGDGIANYLDPDSDGDGIPDVLETGVDTDNDGNANFLDLDSDGDGISDADEGGDDTDADGDGNFMDTDSDGDGISDDIEGDLDTDGDSIPNYQDTDSDGDSIPDSNEGALDTDDDGTPNYLDTDADGDGIADIVEGSADTDGDGVANNQDLDSDGDNINDSVEVGPDKKNPIDSDNDGIPDFQDADSDNDGIDDINEGDGDADGDGIPNNVDTDSNNDGIPDAMVNLGDADGDGIDDFLDADIDGDGLSNTVEGVGDSDGDGVADFYDTDSDGDGVDDAIEQGIDSDGDGTPNYLDTDSDNDGVNDLIETGVDTDGDGIPNYLDTDSDGDGISDTDETGSDTDADGIPNSFDVDSDGDGILDKFEGDNDTDNDGMPDYLDTDADGDTIDDALEGGVDTDGDGVADNLDLDSDGDGISDIDEGSEDTDGDGTPNFKDTDSDGDDIGDAIESAIDTDADGVADYLDSDSDNDGISDADEGVSDSDNDGIGNALDSDSDGDGIPDSIEGNIDTDGDGSPNYIDQDSDGDSINDSVEAGVDGSNPTNTDGDGVPDYIDSDSDNDGVSDSVEGSQDSDGDGVPDTLDQDANNDGILDNKVGNGDTDGDGVADNIDSDIDGDGIANTEEGDSDTDGDGIPDYADTDSDGDGIADSIEGNGDTDGDGIADYLDDDSDGDGLSDASEVGADANQPVDTDADAIPDYRDEDSDGDGIADEIEGSVDTDNDGIADYLDSDADGDGIADEIEKNTDTDNDGAPDYIDNDSDGDGITDNVEVGSNTGQPIDTDGDQIPDYLDTDSDNDGTSDANEGILDSDGDGILDVDDEDANNDGIIDTLAGTGDADNDGIPNERDGDIDGDGIANSAEGNLDTDSDGTPDFADADADNDGISDRSEGTGDLDGDGIANYIDTDSDGDGIDDAFETAADVDGDGIPNHLDLDSDGDGISDAIEAAGGNNVVDTDSDGIADFMDTDSDNDGVSDKDEGVSDPDGDGLSNYRDTDSDADGIFDVVEGDQDSDGDGVSDYLDTDADSDGIDDAIESVGDSDGDSIPDYLDNDSDNDSILDSEEGAGDSDGDGIPNYIDNNNQQIGQLDSDSDGILDRVEGTGDNDGDGIPNYIDPDSDNDGIPDSLETNADADGDGLPNSLDLDSDNDGLSDYLEYFGTDAGNDGLVDGFIDNNGDGQHDLHALLPVGRDTDGDSVPDYLDIDSDNDGLTDAIETYASDRDGNGRIDSFVDANDNGLDDSVELSTQVIVDTDGDLIPNFLDIDSDQDGLPDLVESQGIGYDSDGYIDAFVDANGDGLDDSLLIAPVSAIDSDHDSIPDYLEVDSDNDGISDLREAGGIDTDNDGMVDALADNDRDGIPNSVDVDYTRGQDNDNDGIDDRADVDFVVDGDDDGDGIINNLDPDADGNGFADNPSHSLQVGAALPDIDGDNQQALPEAVVQTGVNGYGGGCSVIDSGKNAKRDPVFALMMLLALVFLRRHSVPHVAATRFAQRNTLCLISVVVLSLSAVSNSAHAQNRPQFDRTTYIGIGGGISMLDPITEGTKWEVGENNSTGFQLTLGMDFTKRLTAELHFASLGEAVLQEVANTAVSETVSYEVAGASMLVYAGQYNNNAEFIRREGLAAFLRIGAGFMRNSTGADYEQLNEASLLWGVGGEYAMHNGLGIRGEFISFDGDAQYAQLALVYRFGVHRSEPEAPPTPVLEPVRVLAPEPKPLAQPIAKPAPGDYDNDGIDNSLDKCPRTSIGTPVGVDGCEIFNGIIDGVNFEMSSARLTAQAKAVLENATQQLIKFPSVRIQIDAHTDNMGDDAFNMALSRKRVVAVANYFVMRGIAKSRFTGRAYGETRPIASNDTPEGRQKNRRVELKSIQ